MPQIKNTALPSVRVEPTRAGEASPFGPALDLEQADRLMRQTDQYSQWQRISQNTDSKKFHFATTTIARDRLLQKHTQGEEIDSRLFNKLTGQLQQAGITLPVYSQLQVKNVTPAQAALSSASTQAAGPAQTIQQPSSDNPLHEENLLILSMQVPVVGVQRTILGYGDHQSSLLPLGEISQMLDFSISVDPEAGRAEGWFIAEDRSFSLDTTSRSITIDGKTSSWSGNDVVVGEDEIYVDSRIMSEWFPLDFEVSRAELNVMATPRELLPLQTQYEREQERLRLLRKYDRSIKYELSEAPYDFLSFPTIDFFSSSGIETMRQDSPEFRQKYSIVAEGDFAYMGANVFVSGSENEGLYSTRIRLNRYDYNSELLGPMKANKISIGDISPTNFPVLGRPDVENGILLSNADLYRSEDYDSTRFEGNMQPGWDVELYRNNELLQSIRVSGDGRYLFDEVPVFFGKNEFRIKAFGPQGQRRLVEDKTINVGSQMIAPGEFEYNLSATQRENTILGIDEEHSNREGEGNGGRYTTTLRYGLSNRLSVTSGVSSIEFDDTVHNYLQAGISGTLSSLYGQADYIVDTASGSGVSFLAQTSIGNTNIKAKHASFIDFIEEDNPNRFLESETELKINGQIPKFGFTPPTSYTLSGKNTTYDNSITSTINARLSSRFKYFNLSNENYWTHNGSNAIEIDKLDGRFEASGNIGGGRIIAGLQYKVGSENEILQYRLAGNWPISSDLGAGGEFYHNIGENGATVAKMNLDWDTGKFLISPNVTFDSESGYGAFLNFTFSLGRDPLSKDFHLSSTKRSGKGATTAFVYHDKNNNKVFDKEDNPLPEVEVIAPQAGQKTFTSDEGFAYFNNLTAFDPTDIDIDAETLEDPFWYPSVDGVAVVPRAGQVNKLEIPIVTTGEIDGTLYTLDSNGVRQPLVNVQLEIVADDGKVVKTVTSEYDGFYLFEKVFPGNYRLRITPGDPQITSLDDIAPVEITIGTDGTISSGNDIIFKTPVSETKNTPIPQFDSETTPAIAHQFNKQAPAEHHLPISETINPTVNPNSELNKGRSSITVRPITVQTGSAQKTSSAILAAEPLAPLSFPPAIGIREINGSASAIKIRPLVVEQQAPAEHRLAVDENINPIVDQNSKLNKGGASITVRPATVQTDPVRNSSHTIPSTGTTTPLAFSPTIGKKGISIPVASTIHFKTEEQGTLGAGEAVPSRSRYGAQSTNHTNQSVAQHSPPAGRPFDPIFPQGGRLFDPFFPTAPAADRVEVARPTYKSSKQIAHLALRDAHNTGNIARISTEKNKIFGVHLASYKTRTAAEKGLGILTDQLKEFVTKDDFTIKKVNLGPEKGIWYRVVCGNLEQQSDAVNLANSLGTITDYAKNILIEEQPIARIAATFLEKGRHTPKRPNAAAIVKKYASMQ